MIILVNNIYLRQEGSVWTACKATNPAVQSVTFDLIMHLCWMNAFFNKSEHTDSKLFPMVLYLKHKPHVLANSSMFSSVVVVLRTYHWSLWLRNGHPRPHSKKTRRSRWTRWITAIRHSAPFFPVVLLFIHTSPIHVFFIAPENNYNI